MTFKIITIRSEGLEKIYYKIKNIIGDELEKINIKTRINELITNILNEQIKDILIQTDLNDKEIEDSLDKSLNVNKRKFDEIIKNKTHKNIE